MARSISTRFFSRLRAGCRKPYFRHCMSSHTFQMVLMFFLVALVAENQKHYTSTFLLLRGDSPLDKFELVTRNTEEIVTADELLGLLEQKLRPRAYVGYETSGKVHLGHMLTANKLLDLQKAGLTL